jgi:hypothetical protein
MIHLAQYPVASTTIVHTSWWSDISALQDAANRTYSKANFVSFRLGNVVLDIDSTYPPLLDELRNNYGDCEVTNHTPTEVPHLRCAARFIEQTTLVVLHFSLPCNLPHLCDVALCLIRPRAELQHFFDLTLDNKGWRLIANKLEPDTPLLAANSNTAIFDVSVEPSELLLNFAIGIAQLVQKSVIFIHAGGVSIDGRGTLLIGRSGKGKSTTTAALASRGNALLGDETVGIRVDSCEIVSFRRTLKLRPGPSAVAVTNRLANVTHAKRVDAQGLSCAWIDGDKLFPGLASVSSASLQYIFFLRNFQKQALAELIVPTLDLIDELQALTMSLSAIASWPISPAHRVIRIARLINLFSQCRCYFLDLGTPDATAALIERIVKNHA